MSKRRQKEFRPDYFSSCAADGHDSFLMVYDSLLKSPKFQALSNSAKLMYFYCRNQLSSAEGRRTLYKHAQENETEYDQFCFVFPANQMQLYGIDRSNGARALRELMAAGFIEKREQNAHRHKVNIYRFSAGWKT